MSRPRTRARIRVPICKETRHFVHLLFAALTMTLACAVLRAQSGPAPNSHISTIGSEPVAEELDRQEVLRRVEFFENLVRNAATLHIDHQNLIKVYKNLGVLYNAAGMIPKAAVATQRAIELMSDGPKDELAEEFNRLSMTHSLLGNLKQAEKDQQQALVIRKEIGDPLGVALTWTDMASTYLQDRHYKKASEYARKSYDILGNRTDIEPTDHIAVLQVMASALCGMKRCSEAVPIMKRAVEESKSAYGIDSLSAAIEGFGLGVIFWNEGDNIDAADWMRRSLARMKVNLGWGAPVYVSAVKQYAQFLYQTGQSQEASNAESEVRHIESILDARTVVTRGEEFLSQGKR